MLANLNLSSLTDFNDISLHFADLLSVQGALSDGHPYFWNIAELGHFEHNGYYNNFHKIVIFAVFKLNMI